MPLPRLPWRISLPFFAFVLTGTIALVVWMGWNLTREDRAQFEKLARTNASFLSRMNLPASDRMARQLTEVLGIQVHFRSNGNLVPQPLWLSSTPNLATIPADANCHRSGSMEAVAVPLPSGHDLFITRPAFTAWRSVMQPRTYAILAAFWCVALLLAWLITRGLVRPLQNLASQLPAIETADPLHLPEASRHDEIGDLARAFLRTNQALKHERQQREQAEKLAVLGRMTAALAHEIQNPVSAIKMHAQLAALDANLPAAHLINTEADRISDLVNQWLFLSKPDPPVKSAVNLQTLLQQSLQSHASQTQHSQITIDLDLPTDLIVEADQRRLLQVFNNLINNAIQSMPQGGTLTITGIHQSTSHQTTLTFTDTGGGFSPAALERHAEFFFSEKEGGMGIGLSVVSEILKAHHGTLTITNRTPPAQGASVTISLPA
ncbi:sensor histidine kinase [Phragmitibacter flavus]|nr:HAMP domain-containing sensor histidine kinase [Phragmitibacter flavus]